VLLWIQQEDALPGTQKLDKPFIIKEIKEKSKVSLKSRPSPDFRET
jgi:hypothetical protein